MSQLIGKRFEVHKPIGEGAMGEVYLGMDTLTGERVAIKALKSSVATAELITRFEREGEALRQLNHPNIVKVLASFEDSGQHYIMMEYVGGGSLRDLLSHSPQLPVERVLKIGLELTDALTRAHLLNIVHRDIKPANILLADDGAPRLTDFGIASVKTAPRVTQTGAMVGTIDYLSPEACRGEAVDTRADMDEVTLIIPAETVDDFGKRLHGAELSEPYRLITLDIELPPDLTGFMAYVAGLLGAAKIPIIPLGAFRRDHLLVPAHHFERAWQVLKEAQQP